MEKPSMETIAFFERNVPDDARARRSRMFGMPCAFVNGHMFFGTFGQSVVVRVGEDRASALARGRKVRVFEPLGRTWKEYVQVDTGALRDSELKTLASEALEWTARLPPKGADASKSGAPKTAKRRPAVAQSNGRPTSTSS